MRTTAAMMPTACVASSAFANLISISFRVPPPLDDDVMSLGDESQNV